MTTLAYLKMLDQLRQISRGDNHQIDVSKLEADFLGFSAYSKKRALTVVLPKLYQVEEEEKDHVQEALTSLGLTILGTSSSVPEYLDIGGGFTGNNCLDCLLLLSLQQYQSDHQTNERSYLNPLLEKIYSEGGRFIQDFSIHEAIVGKVTAKRGDLDLSEVHLFPGKFYHGPYRLEADLDTPQKTVQKLRKLEQFWTEIGEDLKSHLLDYSELQQVTEKSLELREKLGALSRYHIPSSSQFSVSVNSCVLRQPSGTLFYLFEPNNQKNVLVYWGNSPFAQSQAPAQLQAFSGDAHQHTLVKLTEMGFYIPSEKILEERMTVLTKLQEQATRQAQAPLSGHEDFQTLMEELQRVQEFFTRTVNPDMRKEHLLKQFPEILEFVVYPATEDPVVHELLPRLSWNQTIRRYHNSSKFKNVFEQAGEEEKAKMLQEVQANLMFANQQNNDVNVWLYQNHQDFCQKKGIEFKLMK